MKRLNLTFIHFFLLFSLEVCIVQLTQAQEVNQQFQNGVLRRTVSNQAKNINDNVTSLILPTANNLVLPDSDISKAEVNVKLDLAKGYGNLNFSTTFQFDLIAIDEANVTTTICQSCEVTITHDKPEILFHKDISATLKNTKEFQLDILNLSATGLPLDVFDQIRATLNYEVTYGIAPIHLAINVSNLSSSQMESSKRFRFTWANWVTNIHFPNYQFQLLRLYNIDPTKTVDEKYYSRSRLE